MSFAYRYIFAILLFFSSKPVLKKEKKMFENEYKLKIPTPILIALEISESISLE